MAFFVLFPFGGWGLIFGFTARLVLVVLYSVIPLHLWLLVELELDSYLDWITLLILI
jgi:hypothetical protein